MAKKNKRKVVKTKFNSRVPGLEWGVFRQSDGQLMDTASTFILAQSKKRACGGEKGDFYVDTYQVF